MKRISSLITAVALSTGLAVCEDKPYTIKCIAGLKFDVTEVKLKAGDTLKLTFLNPDIMQHNIVIVKPGTSQKVSAAAMGLGGKGMEKGWIPESEDIIAHSKLLNKGEEDKLDVKFDEAGTYPFICTFPGHSVIMKGTIIVE